LFVNDFRAAALPIASSFPPYRWFIKDVLTTLTALESPLLWVPEALYTVGYGAYLSDTFAFIQARVAQSSDWKDGEANSMTVGYVVDYLEAWKDVLNIRSERRREEDDARF
jgi:hypothetical protein